jgi:hypothetical protein
MRIFYKKKTLKLFEISKIFGNSKDFQKTLENFENFKVFIALVLSI